MNRPLIITAGIVILLLVLGLWVYLMLFGTPDDSGEVFSNLGFELSTQPVTITPPDPTTPLPETTVDTQNGQLRQLTTRPVAGSTFITHASSSGIRYVERGTGHVYEIDLDTGIETPLSRTTIPQTTEATFSPNGRTIALTAHTQYTTSVFVGEIGEEVNIEGIRLQPGAKNISFATNEDVLYTVTQNGTTEGYRHNIHTLNQSKQFSFNYANVDVAWGEGLQKTYLATKPSHDLEGYIYSTANDILTPETFSAYGLSALFSNDFIVTTYTQDNQYTSTAVSAAGEYYNLPILSLKEKCIFDTFAPNYLWCTAPADTSSPTFVEDWYKGKLTAVDDLWLVDIADSSATLYADFTELSGRTVDVKRIDIDQNGSALSFINKLDHTLWLYDLTTE